MAYLYLGIAIVAEVAGTAALKGSVGFTKLGPSMVVIVATRSPSSSSLYHFGQSQSELPMRSGVGLAWRSSSSRALPSSTKSQTSRQSLV